MTVREAIDIVDGIKPNQYTDEQKMSWLSALDGTINEEIIKTHRENTDIKTPKLPYTGEKDENNKDIELLAPYPYDDIYKHWLFAQIDYLNSETTKYENSMIMFNSAYMQFWAWYNKNNAPLSGGFKV